MTTAQMAPPVVAVIPDSEEAQQARWIAWRSRGAAADRITARRMRIAFAAIVIGLVCVTLAAVLS